MKLIDHADMPDVVRFVYRQLDRVDTRMLGSLTLSRNLTGYFWNGYSWPKGGEWRLRCAMTSRLRVRDTVRCRKCMRRWDRKPLCKCRPRQRYTFRNADEVMVFLVGHEVWHFLVDTKQRPGARNAKAEEHDADANGRDWVRRWRCGRRSNAER